MPDRPGPGTDARIWALVPLRGLEHAKTRLGAELDAEERLELVVEMARRTLAATRDARGVEGTVLVTADPAAADLARTFGAEAIVQQLPGLNAALREARSVAVKRGATTVLILPIDLPGISADTLEALLGAANSSRGEGIEDLEQLVLAVPDRHGTGTNALLVRPPEAIEPLFGEGSFARHRAAANAAGARFVTFEGPLTLDVDTAADLLVAETVGSGDGKGRGGRHAA